MDRRLLLVPASALCAHAQSSPEAIEAERALRERVDQFYKLQQGKKFRQAEELVAEDSKEDYYNAKKTEVKDFHIEKVELSEGNTKAKVTIKGRMVVLLAGVQEFVMPTESTWKVENDKWCWYIDPSRRNLTPFGMMTTGDANAAPKGPDRTGEAPDLNEILKKIAIDRTVIAFTAEATSQNVRITNGTPGPLTLVLDPHVATIAGLEAAIDKPNLDGGEVAFVTLTWKGSGKLDDVVYIRVDPYLRGFNVRVTAK